MVLRENNAVTGLLTVWIKKGSETTGKELLRFADQEITQGYQETK